MKINHIHLESCSSTQEKMKDLNVSNLNTLVTCDNQTKGYGRNNNIWDFIGNSLACSFTLDPHIPILLTTIEIAVIIKMFFQKKITTKETIKLKWPNDIFFNDKKCGGIIIDLISIGNNQKAVIGLGLNFSSNSKYSFLPIDISNLLIKDLAYEMYSYILNNRLETNNIIKMFNNDCLHMNQEVIIDKQSGKFIGLSENGEALLLSNEKIITVTTGRLNINSNL